jgi:Na+/proline symporter/signal transduction histidine kinase
MFSNWFIILITFGYLALLFFVANFAEKKEKQGKGFLSSPYTYALSLAVYCSAWTFFGSVGRAANHGLDFLTIYLGPTLAAPLFYIIIRKIIRISKVQRITSIADFISARYGKNTSIGILVSIICLLGIIPYIAVQLKAISFSFSLLGEQPFKVQSASSLFSDTSLYLAIGLGLFTILYGTKHVESTEKHAGLVSAIAFESIVKLISFLAIGIFVVFFMFNGFSDIFSQAAQNQDITKLYTLNAPALQSDWFWMILLSFFAIFLLPRQFQVSVVENVNEKHLFYAMWVFPLFLLLINIFVIPIALAGNVWFTQNPINPDAYVIALPVFSGNKVLPIFAYLGGFSAAASMVAISTIAISTMVSNNLIMPLLAGSNRLNQRVQPYISKILIYSRRGAILLIILLAFLYNKSAFSQYTLLSIGLISFAAVAQFAPAVLGGIFWKNANLKGAFSGLLVGFIIWGYTLALPSFSNILFWVSGEPSADSLIAMLNPQNLFNLNYFEPLANGVFWSLAANVMVFALVSVLSTQGSTERNQAEIFVDIFKYSKAYETSVIWRGKAYIKSLKALLDNFLGVNRANTLVAQFAEKYNKPWSGEEADALMVNFAERHLAGAIGSASARIMVSSVTSEEEIAISDVIDILKESQQLISANQELVKKSSELKRAYQQIALSNAKLKEIDRQKDEFLTVVAHELRTPITSIKALSEIIYDTPDLEDDERNQFLATIIKESERLSRLISQVLDLEKLESGNQKLRINTIDINEIIQDAIAPLAKSLEIKNTKVNISVSENIPVAYGDKDRLTQVVQNLIGNAAKYVKPNAGEIKISGFYLDNNLKVVIADNGEGIESELHHKIFDKFYQAKNSYKKAQGSGLGLAICKQIIALHEGKIWVESEPDKGAKFCFTIPTKRF